MRQIWSANAGGTFQQDDQPAASMDPEIRSILGESGWLAMDVAGLSDEDDLYAAGLTSHGSVNLMLALEERFQVEFPEHLLRRRTFESIAAIREAIAGLLQGTSGA
ncbi:MAG TPA: acyl carrier protein [Azospirillum sp.]|nr:acyl carrier protein [Azospirillum sp.]